MVLLSHINHQFLLLVLPLTLHFVYALSSCLVGYGFQHFKNKMLKFMQIK